MKWHRAVSLGSLGLALVALSAAMLALGCPAGSIQTIPGLVVYPPPPPDGKYVDVGGYRLFYKMKGTGDTPVILMAGEDENLRIWDLVFDDIAKFTQVVTYDRGGVGWSDEGMNPRNGRMIANEMHAFIEAIGVEPPYVICAHSLGGLYARLYAHTYPDEIAGILLLDTTHEDNWRRSALELDPRVVQLTQVLMGVGEAVITINQPGSLGEYYNITNLCDEVRGNRSLPDVPLLLLSQDLGNFSIIDDDNEARALFLVQEFYQEQARLVRKGKWEVVENTSHFVMVDQPAKVIDGLQRVLAGW